jgi:hypothetical protein
LDLKKNPKRARIRGYDFSRIVGLPPSRQKEILRYLAKLKSPQAQFRNKERALHVLAGGEARFMARSWNTGRV